MLGALDEKNQLLDEVAENTKVLQSLITNIQTNAEKIAQLKQELTFMDMEYKEKERIMTEIDHDVDHKRNLLSQLKDEVNEKEDLIEELNWTYERKTSELKMVQERPATSKHAPQARDDDEVDDLDEMLEEYIWRAGCTVPLWRLGGGYYMFGTRKIFAKVMNG